MKKARCQFCDVKFGNRILEAVCFIDYEMHSFTQIILISQTSEARVLFDVFRIWFCISDIFVNYKLSNKSK